MKPSTVKHMRDSFDPYCSNVRVGWYQREILPSRANVIQAYTEASESAMVQIVREILTKNDSLCMLYTAPVSDSDRLLNSLLSEKKPFANRLRTGEQAETYFIDRFPTLPLFAGGTLDDTRKLGIGFDFRAVFEHSYQAIEVKGITEDNGYISFTDKEWSVAQILGELYTLALVRSLNRVPRLELINNPTVFIPATMRSVESVSVNWNAKV